VPQIKAHYVLIDNGVDTLVLDKPDLWKEYTDKKHTPRFRFVPFSYTFCKSESAIAYEITLRSNLSYCGVRWPHLKEMYFDVAIGDPMWSLSKAARDVNQHVRIALFNLY
jgi:hypothetical protein